MRRRRRALSLRNLVSSRHHLLLVLHELGRQYLYLLLHDIGFLHAPGGCQHLQVIYFKLKLPVRVLHLHRCVGRHFECWLWFRRRRSRCARRQNIHAWRRSMHAWRRRRFRRGSGDCGRRGRGSSRPLCFWLNARSHIKWSFDCITVSKIPVDYCDSSHTLFRGWKAGQRDGMLWGCREPGDRRIACNCLSRRYSRRYARLDRPLTHRRVDLRQTRRVLEANKIPIDFSLRIAA